MFEVARNFRNEGVDVTHNPEFTALEAYQPFADYTTMRWLIERLVRAAATTVYGRPVLRRRKENAATGNALTDLIEIDLSEPFCVVTVCDAVGSALGAAITHETSLAELQRLADLPCATVAVPAAAGEMVEELYAELVEADTTTPTFFLDFPVETSPLTRPTAPCQV